MKKRLSANTSAALFIVLGIVGGIVVGGAFSFLFQERDNFTVSQKAYISGVNVGAGYLQTKLDIEKQPQPTADENNLLRRPQDRCIRAFYPALPLQLAGCLDSVEGKDWTMPRL